jgi:hypothetical protein
MDTLRIEVHNDKTNIIYISNGTKMFSFTSPIGESHIVSANFSEKIAKDWMSYVIWCLHTISYVDRVPADFLVNVFDHSLWYSNVLSRYSYSQFYIKNKKPYVIIENNITTYERRKKAFPQFKI